jgi:hypothetical protein
MRPRWTWIVTPFVAAGVLAGCGSDKAPTAQIAKKVRADVSARTQLPTGEVNCPGNVKARKGAQFECVARVDNQSVPIRVTLTNASGTHVDLRYASAVLLSSKLITGIREEIKKQDGVDAAVDCGPQRVIVRDANDPDGKLIKCTAKAGDTTQDVVVTVLDNEGNVSFKVVPTA